MKEAEVDENDENNEADAEDEPKGVKSPQKSKKKRKLKKSKGFLGTSYPFIYDTYRIYMNSLLILIVFRKMTTLQFVSSLQAHQMS